MVTLTYRDVNGWSGRHLSEYLGSLRKWSKRRGFTVRYVWVAEMQERGAIHYHVLIWLPRGITMPKADKQGWWPHGMTRTEWARRPVGYMVKYASKGETAPLPKGARMYGTGGLEGEYLGWYRWHKRPLWLREIAGPDEVVRPSPGGGRLNMTTGEFYRPRYGLVSFSKQFITLRRLEEDEWRQPEHKPASDLVIFDQYDRSERSRAFWKELHQLRQDDRLAFLMRIRRMFKLDYD